MSSSSPPRATDGASCVVSRDAVFTVAVHPSALRDPLRGARAVLNIIRGKLIPNRISQLSRDPGDEQSPVLVAVRTGESVVRHGSDVGGIARPQCRCPILSPMYRDWCLTVVVNILMKPVRKLSSSRRACQNRHIKSLDQRLMRYTHNVADLV